MSKSAKPDSTPVSKPSWALRLREVGLVFAAGISLLILLSLISYTPGDPGWSSYQTGVVHNIVGPVGAWFSDLLLSFLGFFGFLTPLLMIYGLWVLHKEDHGDSPVAQYLIFVMRCSGFLLILVGGSGLSSLFLSSYATWLPQGGGGIVGDLAGRFFSQDFGFHGSALCLLMLFLIGLTFFSGVSWNFWGRVAIKKMIISLKKSWQGLLLGLEHLWSRISASRINEPTLVTEPAALPEEPASPKQSLWDKFTVRVQQAGEKAVQPQPALQRREPKLSALSTLDDMESQKNMNHKDPSVPRPLTSMTQSPRVVPSQASFQNVAPVQSVQRIEDPMHQVQKFETPVPPPRTAAPRSLSKAPTPPKKLVGGLPGLDLLDDATPSRTKVSDEALARTAKLVEEKLADFNVQAKVEGVCPGPVVTRFEIQLAPGVKVSKLAGLAKDLARSLSVMSVRIVEVIPGKTCVGLEVPNEVREMVRLKEVLGSSIYQEQSSPLTLALGKDISGKPLLADLGKMPHLLVAGTTGSGKSVGVNAMILSMLFKAGPEDLKMIMIDPKMLELSIYEGIPHLLTPVVTDMKEAASALRWCVKEMDIRYRIMASLGVRNIAGLNQLIEQAARQGEEIINPIDVAAKLEFQRALQKMPYVVVIVDEFADMMMVVGKKVEDLIARIAQKARAAGIHLILATQRPSVDVITGLIKANIPTRMAFQVSSKIDSRTILDQQGAEQLLGHGDMLYLPPGSGVPIRVHGAFVADHEVHAVVNAWKERGQPNYVDGILSIEDQEEGGGSSGGDGGEGGEDDPLYDQAVQIVMESQRASISSVQRRLKIGYNRAARLLEQMERAGLVSEMQGNGMREILVPNREN